MRPRRPASTGAAPAAFALVSLALPPRLADPILAYRLAAGSARLFASFASSLGADWSWGATNLSGSVELVALRLDYRADNDAITTSL